jgi:hypothetical protein
MLRFFWPLALLLTLLLRAVFQSHPALAEQWYTRGLFRGIRWGLDYTLGRLPFPAFYLVIAGLLGALAWRILRRKKKHLKKTLQDVALGAFNIVCAIVTLFFLLWGFNYNRLPVEAQLDLQNARLDSAVLKAELERQTAVVLSLRTALQPDTARAIPDSGLPASMEAEVRQNVERLHTGLNLPTAGKPRGRQPFWNGFLLRFGAAGIYNPFTGEGNIDRGLHFLTKPYCLAHELCHAYGWGDEGTCNFLAYLSLRESDSPILRYSAELGYWRELAATYRGRHPEDYKKLFHQLPSGFVADLLNIRAAHDKYPEYFEAFRRKTYDQYLKAHGIREGMANYGKVVPLVVAWRNREKKK